MMGWIMATRYHVGTSGFSYPHWREVFYPRAIPPARWLEYYAEQFPTVEINSSFYRLPTEKVFQSWRDRTPPTFVFALKASRFITHVRKLADVEQPMKLFFERAQVLGPRLGPILYQVPPSLKADPALLEQFLRQLPQGCRHAFEFRNASWYTDEIVGLLRHYGAALCIHDWRGREMPLAITSGFGYFRFHGPTGHYIGRYTREEMETWSSQITSATAGLQDAYVYFNNDVGGHAVWNAREMTGLLTS